MAQSRRVSSLEAKQDGSRLRVSSLLGTLVRQQSLLNTLEEGIWKLGGKVLVSTSNNALMQLIIPEIHHPAAQRNIKCYWEQVLQSGGGEEFICSSTTTHPVLWECVTLKKKLTAHLRQQKWREISVKQTLPECVLSLTDKEKASLLKFSYYCLFWNWFLFAWAK